MSPAPILRAALFNAELTLAGAILALACATSPDRTPETIPAVVLSRERRDPVRGGDFSYYLTLEFRDAEGVMRHEQIEVTWREFTYYWEGREACVLDSPARVRIVPCRY